MADQIEQGVFAILLANAKQAPSAITADTVLAEIGLDSLDIVETVFDLEEAFNISIPNPGESDDVETNFIIAADVVAAVRKLIAVKE